MTTVIVDYESGNLHSAEKAFQRMADESGAGSGAVTVTSDPDVIRRADRIVRDLRARERFALAILSDDPAIPTLDPAGQAPGLFDVLARTEARRRRERPAPSALNRLRRRVRPAGFPSSRGKRCPGAQAIRAMRRPQRSPPVLSLAPRVPWRPPLPEHGHGPCAPHARHDHPGQNSHC